MSGAPVARSPRIGMPVNPYRLPGWQHNGQAMVLHSVSKHGLVLLLATDNLARPEPRPRRPVSS